MLYFQDAHLYRSNMVWEVGGRRENVYFENADKKPPENLYCSGCLFWDSLFFMGTAWRNHISLWADRELRLQKDAVSSSTYES